jgi:acyl-CoA synthetase (AMP-forming)/AMP-acid ligase II
MRLAGYKYPRVIEFRKEFPTSAVGKTLRRMLREEELEKEQANGSQFAFAQEVPADV